MKRYADLTDGELLALGTEQLQDLIDYECALEGVPLLPEEPVEPVPLDDELEADVVLYGVGGLYFARKEEALEAMEAITKFQLYNLEYISGGKFKRVSLISEDHYSYPKISTVKAYSPQKWAEVDDITKNRKRELELYAEQEAKYNDLYKKVSAIEGKIYQAIADAQERVRREDEIHSLFGRYLELADNNTVIAMKFLLDAYPDMKEHMELLKVLAPTYFD